jgi:hypothetical protein
VRLGAEPTYALDVCGSAPSWVNSEAWGPAGMLRDELGVAPSPAVQAVHRRLLQSADG